jgi:hypothetical protein
MEYRTEQQVNALGASFTSRYYRALLEGNLEILTAMHAPGADVATTAAQGVTLPPTVAAISEQRLGSSRTAAPCVATSAEISRRVSLLRTALPLLPTPTLSVLTMDAVRTSETAGGHILVTITSVAGGVWALVHSVCLATAGVNAYIVGDTLRILPNNVAAATETAVSMTSYPAPQEPEPEPEPVPQPPAAEGSDAAVRGGHNESKQPRERRRGQGREGGREGGRGGNNKDNSQRDNNRASYRDVSVVLTGLPRGNYNRLQQGVFQAAKPFGWVEEVEIDRDNNAIIYFSEPDGVNRIMKAAKRQGIYIDGQRVRVDYA